MTKLEIESEKRTMSDIAALSSSIFTVLKADSPDVVCGALGCVLGRVLAIAGYPLLPLFTMITDVYNIERGVMEEKSNQLDLPLEGANV